MVAALNRMGLRVVLDVAFNHTFAAGQEPCSVLDKVVPGYYHRLDANGEIERSSCCPNTATEFAMMEKLMRDAILHWARVYKVDGFRFDLMGHHLRDHMLTVRADLDSLTLAEDGLEGTKILLYGEGWDFGEVAGNARGLNASQQNMAGSGIGTFNDRIRDAGRGGGPFTGLRTQGYISGLAIDPNDSEQGAREYQRSHLLYLKDLIRVSLAGNLQSYQFISAKGGLIRGKDLPYRGTAAGYTDSPQENILYLAAHDNETLFDAIQYKAACRNTVADRVRMQCLGISLLALAQGLPFFHAGMEILRSKSLDRDSYRSGDWYNFLDYSYRTNNWGVGLPFADINHGNWGVMRELLNNPALKPEPKHILKTLNHFEEMLKIRKSSPLFRLTTAEAVQKALKFYNTGPNQVLGLIAMSLENHAGQRPDKQNKVIFVMMNADPEPVEFQLDNVDLGDLRLHPVQAESADSVVRKSVYNRKNQRFLIPGRTTAVYVR
jgi:pullulanase-type alpha-1,6-glucosidase